MPKVFFMVPNDDEGRVLGGVCDVESIPRLGEHVMVCGPAFGDRYQGDDGVTPFVVERVQYQIYVDGDEAKEDEAPNVWLREELQPFVPKCVCGDARRVDANDPRRCDECGDKIP